MEMVEERDYCLTLQERMTIYTFLKVSLEGPLTIETLTLWKETFSPEFIEVLTDNNKDLSEFFADLEKRDLTAIEQREKEAYLATFNVLNETGHIPAPLWESVYVTEDQTMFGEPVFQMREQFRQFGLEFAEKGSMPEDHIAIELELMIYLIRYAWQSLMNEKEEEYIKGIYTQYWLHKEHFKHWIQPLTKNILSSHTSSFYKGIAIILQLFVMEDYEYINLLKEGLENE